MSNKYCINCQHHKKEYIQQNGRAGAVVVCFHGDFRDPVTGEAMPCQVIRSNEHWCGLNGKGYTPIPKEPEKPHLIVT